jgi:hypothetical protein
MKAPNLLFLLFVPVLLHAADIHIGDSLEAVKSALGAPNGQMGVGHKLTLFYAGGQVRFVDGKVVSSNLMSPETQAQHAAEDEIQRDARAAQLRAQHLADGQALKAQKLADPDFNAAPPADQLAFWQDFHLHYPEVPCDTECKHAQDQLAAQQQQAAQDRQMALQEQQLAVQQQQLAIQKQQQQQMLQAAQQQQGRAGY